MSQHPNGFASLPGAIGAPVPSHYGNPLVEQRRLAEGSAVVLLERGILQLQGPDRLSWLDSITSQQLRGLAPGASAETLVLDPQGRIEYAPRILDDGSSSWLITEAQEYAALQQWLLKMRFRMRVDILDRSDDFFVLGSLSPSTAAAGATPAATSGWHELIAVEADTRLRWQDPWQHGAAGGHQYAAAQHPAAEWGWSESLLPQDALPALLEHITAGTITVAGTLAAEALRIAAWRPSLSHEVDERSIPHELDWLRSAVHLNKGCYRGQETVAKVHNLGRPPRRLVFLHLDGSDSLLLERGAVVSGDDGADVGVITSVAMHYELGPIALALVRRGTAIDAPLTVRAKEGSLSTAQEVIVPQDAGRTAPPPKLGRLGSSRR